MCVSLQYGISDLAQLRLYPTSRRYSSYLAALRATIHWTAPHLTACVRACVRACARACACVRACVPACLPACVPAYVKDTDWARHLHLHLYDVHVKPHTYNSFIPGSVK